MGLALLGGTVSARAATDRPTPRPAAEPAAPPRHSPPPAQGPAAPDTGATATNNAVYAYDATGRLVGVTDPAGETARYRYDAAGNRLAVDRYRSSTLSVLSLVPPRAAAGARVTLSGTGFSTTAASNKVTLGGKAATVTGATRTRLVVKVPTGAGGGKVAVTVGSRTATAPETFAPAGKGPVLKAVEPPAGYPGSAVVLRGSGFSTVTSDNVVRFNGRLAQVTGRTATTLTVKVPPGATTGLVQVTTPDGRAGSANPFNVPYTGSGEVESSTTTSFTDTTPPLVKVVNGGNLTEVRFDAKTGDSASFGLTESTFRSTVNAELRDPNGNQVGYTAFLYGTAPRFSASDLPLTGRYSLLLAPGSRDTGQARVTLSRPVTAPKLTTTGAPTTVTLTRPGQEARGSFVAAAGTSLSLGVANSLSETVKVSVIAPSGASVVRDTYVYSGRNEGLTLRDLRETGTHTVTVVPTGAVTGTVGLTLSSDLTTTLKPGAAALTKSIGRVGQHLSATFTAGTAPLSFAATGSTVPQSVEFTLFGPEYPSGRYLGTIGANGGDVFHLGRLTPGGTYKLTATPYQGATGSLTLWLSEPARIGPLVADTVRTGTTTRPGQPLVFTVKARAGDGASVRLGAPGTGYSRISFRPPGATTDTYVATTNNESEVNLRAPMAAGTAEVTVQPEDALSGSTTAVLRPDALGGTLTVGGARKSAAVAAVGQNARYTFDGTAGQRLTLDIGASPYYWYLSVWGPDGRWLLDERYVSDTATSSTLPELPATGRYVLTAAPYDGRTGTFTLGLSTTPAAAVHPAPGKAAPAAAPAPAAPRAAEPAGPDVWRPGKDQLAGRDWTTRRGPAPHAPSPLPAPAGTTALTGLVLTLDGHPLPRVTVRADGKTSRTDAQGRFLLAGIDPHTTTVTVDGATANTGARHYGRYDIRVHPRAGQRTDLGFPVWMTALDTAHTTRFAAPATRDVVLTTPRIPGLEVRIPKGSVVRDENGRVVTELGITAIPLDRAPFPLPRRGVVPVYFTVQPGGTYVFPKGAQIVYPNYTHEPAGTRVEFMDYDPKGKGWHVYGYGRVSADAKQVVPDPKTRVWSFHGAMFNTGDLMPFDTSRIKDAVDWLSGDPVDLATGLLTDARTDLAVSGDLGTAEVSRTYWQGDTRKRAFGIGRDLSYNVFLHSEKQYQEVDLYLPGGSKVHFVRTSPGTSYSDAVFEPLDSPAAFRGTKIVQTGTWDLKFPDGSTWVFPWYSPLKEIRDRFGNKTVLTRMDSGSKGPVVRVDIPGGRWIKFTHDAEGRVTGARDNAGRKVTYTYDPVGRLATVTDPAGRTSTYTYDGTTNRITQATDARGITYLKNTYDAEGRVTRQTLTEGAAYGFTYRKNAAGRIVDTRAKQPDGTVRRVEFDDSGYAVADTLAYGTALARRTVLTRGDHHRVDAVTDPFGRRTAFTYDAHDNITSTTELAGTPNARTVARTVFDGPNDLPTAVTDALGHTARLAYDDLGNLTRSTDAAGRATVFTHLPTGQVETVKDPSGTVTRFTYRDGELSAVTDAAGATSTQYRDAAGRPVLLTDAAGSRTRVAYDRLNQTTSVTDPLGSRTSFTYDKNGNTTALTDARGNTTTWAYDTADRPTSATDPLGARASFVYDKAGRITEAVNRLGQKATSEYDALGRTTKVTEAGAGTTTTTYDAVDLPSKITDTAAGTQSFTYDAHDRVTATTGPTGKVTYTYDAADRRTGMTAAGTTTTYTYDTSDLLTGLKTGTEPITFTLDKAGREKTAALPGGITRTTGYDKAGQIATLAYTRGTAQVGDLKYTRDARGLQTALTGSLASVALPAAESGSAFDKANRLTTFAGRSFTYDKEGRLTADGLRTYQWNGRDQLTGLTKGGKKSTFDYGPLGDRVAADIGGTERKFLTDGSNPLVEQTGSGGTAATVATSGVDEFRTRTAGGRTQVYLTDALGSVVGLADAAGKVTTRYTYDPGGTVTRSGAATTNPYTFTGREADGTGLMYYRARYYDPQTGRFLSQDPAGHEGGSNLYQYALSSPTTYTDPSGNFPLLAGCLVGAAVDAAVDYGVQRLSGRKVDWGQVGTSALTGCAMGMLGPLLSGSKWLKRAAEVCRAPNSFTAGTPVLMADGTTEPIERVRTGDRVYAADPETGAAGAAEVTTLIRGTGDKHLVHVSVRAADGTGATVTATAEHPFWLPEYRVWADAEDLRPGDLLRTAGGTEARVAAVRAEERPATVFNLTVTGPHTYHVLAGGTPVLVHNSGCGPIRASVAAQDWANKGAHLHVGGAEVRVFPNHAGGIGAEAIRLSNGTASPKQVQAVLDALRTDVRLRTDLISKATSARNSMAMGDWGANAIGRAAEMNFLIKALGRM
ncbi:RHS repeat-associated core domain-containing protein [Streptomyces sp. NPDC093225]|uniref:RHS repeat-associated core domain-containing protein n=1 Tax=Streptomyces sp. NPDC093225 TaxID=3366034 RepID=UPI003811311A